MITIGQKLSGTYQCAHLAAADVGLQVHIVDSEAASQAEALLVREAVRLRDEEGLTAEEIAAELDMPVDKVREILRVAQEPVSLETPIGEEEDSHLAISFRMTTRSPRRTRLHAPAQGAARRRAQNAHAAGGKGALPALRLEDGRPRTLEEVGKEFNVTRERIRQIEAKALRKLRHPSRSKKLRDFLD